jgi:DNA adenine methylase
MRYPGGKFAIRRWVVSHFPAHQLFVDLYGGAGSVLMAKPRSQGEVYNDIDGEICDVFRVLRDPQQAAELARLLALTPYSRKEFDLAYEVSPDPIENSRRIIFRSFASHGSDGITRAHAGFRIRRNSQSGVTGANDWMNFSENIAAFSKRMQGVTIEQRPAIDLIRDFDKSTTLFYADPPYLIKTRSSSSVKYRNEITEEDHVRLADALHNIMGMAIISGYSSDLYLMLYKDWRFVSRSSRAGHAKPTIECMWLSPNIQTTLF